MSNITNKTIKKICVSLLKYWYVLVCIGIICSIPQKAFASGCEAIYGGGPTCSDTTFTIQKQVLNPITNRFVANLGLGDPRFHGNDVVTFHITLTNGSTMPLQTVIVKDTFPMQLRFIAGPGQFDPTTHILTFTAHNLAAHSTQVFTLTGRVNTQSQFPRQTAFCTTNQVSALPSSGSIVQSSSQFCVEKLSNTPATGANTWELISIMIGAIAGIGLKRLSVKRIFNF